MSKNHSRQYKTSQKNLKKTTQRKKQLARRKHARFQRATGKRGLYSFSRIPRAS